jgi:hypothetical protein
MLRALIEASNEKFNIKDETVFQKSANLIVDLLAGCYLNCGFKWQECFGMPVTLKEEVNLLAILMQSSRLIFEHVLLMKELPVPEKSINGFDVKDINQYIMSQKPKVVKYYQKLVDIDTSKIVIEPQKHYQETVNYFLKERSIFELALVRFQDLVLLIMLVGGTDRSDRQFKHFQHLDYQAENLLRVTTSVDFDAMMNEISDPYFRLQDWNGYKSNQWHKNRIEYMNKEVEKLKKDKDMDPDILADKLNKAVKDIAD